MSLLFKSESASVNAAIEGTGTGGAPPANLGVQPTTGWRNIQPNGNGIVSFRQNVKKKARAPLSRNRQFEKGDIIDLDSSPKLTQDLTKDWVEYWAEGAFLSVTKHTGGTGVSKFAVTPVGSGAVALTAVAAGAYTVASGGTLQANTLVYMRNFGVQANNGMQPVAAASTGTSIKVATAVLEASPPATATLEVAGWRGASGDIQLDVNGNLTSTLADFTTMGLVAGMWVWVGGDPTNGTLNFATAGYRGFAQILTVAAHLLTLKRRQWTVGAADTGTGKTIDLYWGRWLRNVAVDHADYLETSYQLELVMPGVATAGATAYKYAQGNYADILEISAPLASLVETTITFVGTTTTTPTTSRASGASAALGQVSQLPFNTSSGYVRKPGIYDPNNAEAVIAADFESWKLTLDNDIKPQKQHGTLGMKRPIVGKCMVGIDLSLFYVQTDVELAIGDNRTLMFDVGLRNGDGGVLFDIPSFTLTEGDLKFPDNGPVTLSPKVEAFRDGTYSYTLGMMLFPYLPSS